MKKTILGVLAIFFLISAGSAFLKAQGTIDNLSSREKIIYDILPAGRSEFNDFGPVEFKGKRLNLSTFRTQIFGFDDLEKIYTDPDTYLPVRVERDITMWFKKEYLIEEYDQNKFTLLITKFQDGKKIKEYFFQEKGPIHNAVFMPFYLRNFPEFKIGQVLDVRFPDNFQMTLVSQEKIDILGREFLADYYTSKPKKFEVWLSRDNFKIPLKIKGTSGFGYTIIMQEHLMQEGKVQK